MRRSNLMFLVIGVAIIFFGCSKDDFLPPELDQSDQAISSLKAAKAEVEFSGVCSSTAIDDVEIMFKELPNGKALHEFITTWHDDSPNPLVTGYTTWYVKQKIEDYSIPGSEFYYWGKCKLELDNNRGVWQLTWRGYWINTDTGPQLIATAVGQGKSGEVKGLVGKWTYIMDFDQFVYNFEGSYH